ncbi:MAG: glycosyltransferase family 4 protein [Rhodothermales bacterium]|nr:glycosyltransferase family 4 protein [Rhodothermales bacterium]
MRLLFVSHSLPPADRPDSNIGGMQRVAQDLFAALKDHSGVEVIPLVLQTSWADTHRKVPPFLITAYREIRRCARDQSVDVVLFSSMVTASLSVPLQKRLERAGIRTAAIVHGLDVTTDFWLYQRFVPKVFSALDAVLPISRATRDACMDRGLSAGKAFIVPNGISAGRFGGDTGASDVSDRQKASLAEVASRNNVDPGTILGPETLLLTSVGRQVKRKGFAWFVESVMPLLPENVHYWLAGDGPESDTIRQAVAANGLSDRVQLLGRVSDDFLERLYRAGDLFVMPNIHVPGDMEGFGVVLLEAALNGQPAIAAGLEGILDVVSPGENGVLVESGDARGFVDAILSFNSNRQKLSRLSVRSREFTLQTFSWPAVADRYVSVLGQLADTA